MLSLPCFLPVLRRYNDMIMARLFAHEDILELAQYSSRWGHFGVRTHGPDGRAGGLGKTAAGVLGLAQYSGRWG